MKAVYIAILPDNSISAYSSISRLCEETRIASRNTVAKAIRSNGEYSNKNGRIVSSLMITHKSRGAKGNANNFIKNKHRQN